MAIGCSGPVDEGTDSAETVASARQALQAANTWSAWYFDVDGGIKALPAGVFGTDAPAVSSAYEGYCATTCDTGHELLRVIQQASNGKYYSTFWTPSNAWNAGWTALSTTTFSRKPAITSWDFPLGGVQPEATISLVAGVSGGTVKTWKMGTPQGTVTTSSSWSTTNITGCTGPVALAQDQPGTSSGNMYLFCTQADDTVHGWRIAKSSFGTSGHPTTWTAIASTSGTIADNFAISAGQIWNTQINVFAQDPTTQQYWINYFVLSSSTWNGWQPIPLFITAGQALTAGPTAVTRGTGGRVDVFGPVGQDVGGSFVQPASDAFYSDASGWNWNPNVPTNNPIPNTVPAGVGASLFTHVSSGTPHKYIELFALDPSTGKLKETVYRYPTSLGG